VELAAATPEVGTAGPRPGAGPRAAERRRCPEPHLVPEQRRARRRYQATDPPRRPAAEAKTWGRRPALRRGRGPPPTFRRWSAPAREAAVASTWRAARGRPALVPVPGQIDRRTPKRPAPRPDANEPSPPGRCPAHAGAARLDGWAPAPPPARMPQAKRGAQGAPGSVGSAPGRLRREYHTADRPSRIFPQRIGRVSSCRPRVTPDTLRAQWLIAHRRSSSSHSMRAVAPQTVSPTKEKK
jgi:hypothetical protein